MKKSLIFIFVLMFGFVLRASEKSTFFRANKLYKDKKYLEALDLYIDLINDGMKGANLYYNTGNAYFKKGRLLDF